MKKNIAIGVLILIVIFLGFKVFNGNGQYASQQALSVKSSSTQADSLKVLEDIANKEKGRVRMLSVDEQSKVFSTVREALGVSNLGANERPYACIASSGGNITVFQYNSTWDHGSTWYVTNWITCYGI